MAQRKPKFNPGDTVYVRLGKNHYEKGRISKDVYIRERYDKDGTYVPEQYKYKVRLGGNSRMTFNEKSIRKTKPKGAKIS